MRLTLDQFAVGVIRVVNATMEKAIRVVSIERGFDPRRFTLVAFGGAGGLHACELAQSLGIPRVLVPALPGALSAFGILVSDVIKDYSRTILWRTTSDLPIARLKREFTSLSQGASRDFRAEGWQGKIQEQLTIDTRYRGQGYELNIPFSPRLIADFHRSHAQRYGYSHHDREIELVTLRLRATLKSPQSRITNDRQKQPAKSNPQVKTERAPVIFNGKPQTTSIYERDRLTLGKKYSGPAIITEYSATTVIPLKASFFIDQAGNLQVH